jgi:hypothetical protein
MCPFCLSTIGLAVTGAISTGGLTALAVRLSRKKNDAKEIPNANGLRTLVAKTTEPGLLRVAPDQPTPANEA